MDLGGIERNGFASVVAVGPRAQDVMDRLILASAELMSSSGSHVASRAWGEDATEGQIGTPS